MADIILVVVGLVIVLASFLITGKSDAEEQEKEQKTPVMTREMLEACLVPLNAEINHRFDVKFEERWEETIADADDQMSQISNEKIMAVNDFSKEVLEKINQSHSDVVFLYKMMSDKEEELKSLLAQLRKEKKEWEELRTQEGLLRNEEQKQKGARVEQSREQDIFRQDTMEQSTFKPDSFEQSTFEREAFERNDAERKLAETAPDTEPPESSSSEEQLKERFEERLKNYKEEKKDPVQQQTEKLQKSRPDQEKEERKRGASENINEEILMLYQEGMTVKEISKKLNRGQGEVKLVVDLFTKKQTAEG